MNIFTPNTKIKSSLVNENFSGLANGSEDTAANSLELMRRLTFFSHVQSGYKIPTSANLTATIATGVAIVNGKYVSRTAVSKAFTASKDTYVDLLDDGTLVYIAVANNATTGMTLSVNSDGSNALRLAKVVTSGTAITSVQQSFLDPLGNSIYNTTGHERNIIYKSPTSNRYSTQQSTPQEVTGTKFTYRSGSQPENLAISLSHMSCCDTGGNSGEVGILINSATIPGSPLEGYLDPASPWVRSTLDYDYTIPANTTITISMFLYREGGAGGTVFTCTDQARWVPQFRVIARKAA
jgi:hypothetical protein